LAVSLALAAGIVLALALPGPGLAILVLVFPGLFLEAIHRSPSPLRSALLGWLAGTVHWIIATNWVVPVMHHYGGLPVPAAVTALAGMASILALTWAATAGLTYLGAPAARPWLFGFAWIAFEVLRQSFLFRFPWNPTAASVAPFPMLLTSLPVWGASGLGWALVALGAGAWAALRPATRVSGAVLAAVALLLTGAFSAAAPSLGPAAGEPLRVAALQPGTSLEEKWDPSQGPLIARKVWNMTREAAAGGARLVLWPESAVPYALERDPAYREIVERLARELGIHIVLNSIGATPSGGYTNSAYSVGPEGLEAARYDKIRLVPFGEYVPFIGRFAFAKSLVREVGRFTPGRKPVLLPAGGEHVGMAICFEVVFPSLIASEVHRGATLLITLTNDGWYGYSWAPRQHFAQVILRAAETRRWFVRAALTGISAFVDPRGRVVASLGVGKSGILYGLARPLSGQTLRVRLGNWWVLVCALAIPLLLLPQWRRWRGERGAP